MRSSTIAIVTSLVIFSVITVVCIRTEQAYTNELVNFHEDWADEMDIAMITSRMNIATEIRVLKDMQDDLEEINKPFWRSSTAQDLLEAGVGTTIDGFVLFSGGSENDSEAFDMILAGNSKMDAFVELME